MRKCERCKKPVNVELTGWSGRMMVCDEQDPKKTKPYGRYSIRIDCPFCHLRQKNTYKFYGEEATEIFHIIAEEMWNLMKKKIKPEPNQKWSKLCWAKELNIR